MSRSFNSEERAKLTQLIREGGTVMQEVEDLTGSLSDTIKNVAEELQIKPNILRKAIKLAHSGGFESAAEEHSVLEDILHAAGKMPADDKAA